MNLLTQIAGLLIDTAFSVYIGFVWLRFILQLVHGDFYNPFSQFIVKVTSPLLRPMRRIVPSLAGMDTAALVLILLLEMAAVTLDGLLAFGTMAPPLPLLLVSIFLLIKAAIRFYLLGIFISVVLSWVAQGSRTPASMMIYQIFEPALAPFRRILPDMGGLDFSPMVAGLVLVVFGKILTSVIVGTAPLLGQWIYLVMSPTSPWG